MRKIKIVNKTKRKRYFKSTNIVLFLGFVLITAIFLSGAVSAAGLADSPKPKFQHDNNNTGQSQYKGPQTNNTKWKYHTAEEMDSSPAIGSDGTIYVGGNEKGILYAMHPNGKLKWKYQTEHNTEYDGIYSSPAIGSDGTIYVGGGNKKLYAINPNGTLKWKYNAGGFVDSSPAIGSDGTIYIGSSTIPDVGNNTGYLHAINPNGTLKWKYRTGGIITSSPAISSDGTIYIGSWDCKLYAINSNGTLKWKYLTEKGIDAAPAIGSDGTIYVGGANKLYAINNGTLKWKYTTIDRIGSSPAISSNSTIYVWCIDNKLYAINSNGTLKWKYQADQTEFSWIVPSPAIGSDGTVYVGSVHDLYALGSKGTLKWKYRAKEEIVSSPSIGSDGTLYFGSVGNLYAIADKMVSAKPKGGLYNTSKKVTLTMSKPGTIYWRYYVPNKATVWSRYASPITINKTSIIQFYAEDMTGNKSQIYTEKYIIDRITPKIVSTNPKKRAKKVSRTMTITLKFSEKIKKSINWSKVYMKNITTGKKVSIRKWVSGNKLYIKMTYLRYAYNWYSVYIPKSAIRDYSGNKLKKAYTFRFKTRRY